MDLSELTAYAEEKFHIREQRKWVGFHGFSVMAHPATGRWIALLIRRRDPVSRAEVQLCDIKCGRLEPAEKAEPFLSRPFRMEGDRWVGVSFGEATKPEVVFRLFDRAVYSGEKRGYTIVLDATPAVQAAERGAVALPAAGERGAGEIPDVPQKIREMLRLYEYTDGSFAQKCRNFYRQGKFMEDYEDDAPWSGVFRRYFTTYHDLNIGQLRGYFTWRARVRKGVFSPIPASLAYLYVYELINGIGTDSPEDALKKMRDFETGFIDSGIGDSGMRGNLRRWEFEYAVTRGLPPELARQYADPAVIKRDEALAVLKNSKDASDEDIFSALCALDGKRLAHSPAALLRGGRGKRIFAAVWRAVAEEHRVGGNKFFTACFGRRRLCRWYPFANAVYWQEELHPDADYELDAGRSYRCRGGEWRESRYDDLFFDRKLFRSLLHETDRLLRKYFKTGAALREAPDEAWASPFVERVLAEERRRESEAARPKVTIDFSGLDRIRRDALVTMDSLLTEEDTDGPAAPETPARAEETRQAATADEEAGVPPALDETLRRILLDLINGGPKAAGAAIKASHMMPSVAADAVNEALFDAIGDNAVECDGEILSLVEDYREDILKMFGGGAGGRGQ